MYLKFEFNKSFDIINKHIALFRILNGYSNDDVVA